MNADLHIIRFEIDVDRLRRQCRGKEVEVSKLGAYDEAIEVRIGRQVPIRPAGRLMANITKPGVVIFTGDKERLAKFYEAMTGLTVRFSEDDVTVLGSDEFELVIHALPAEPPVEPPPLAREDSYIKPFFPVTSLSDAREKAVALGGQLRPRNEEWEARGFRACEAIDPDGNVIQFREEAP